MDTHTFEGIHKKKEHARANIPEQLCVKSVYSRNCSSRVSVSVGNIIILMVVKFLRQTKSEQTSRIINYLSLIYQLQFCLSALYT